MEHFTELMLQYIDSGVKLCLLIEQIHKVFIDLKNPHAPVDNVVPAYERLILGQLQQFEAKLSNF